MPLIEASLEDAQGRVVLPDRTWFHFTIPDKPTLESTKGNAQRGTRAGNGMLRFPVEVMDGDCKGARIRHMIMVSGFTRDGEPMPISRFVEFIDIMAADGCSWKCKSCGQSGDRRFKRERLHGRTVFMCPDCGERERFVVETDEWQGHRFNGLSVNQKQEGSDEDQSNLSRLTAYGELPSDTEPRSES